MKSRRRAGKLLWGASALLVLLIVLVWLITPAPRAEGLSPPVATSAVSGTARLLLPERPPG